MKHPEILPETWNIHVCCWFWCFCFPSFENSMVHFLKEFVGVHIHSKSFLLFHGVWCSKRLWNWIPSWKQLMFFTVLMVSPRLNLNPCLFTMGCHISARRPAPQPKSCPLEAGKDQQKPKRKKALVFSKIRCPKSAKSVGARTLYHLSNAFFLQRDSPCWKSSCSAWSAGPHWWQEVIAKSLAKCPKLQRAHAAAPSLSDLPPKMH